MSGHQTSTVARSTAGSDAGRTLLPHHFYDAALAQWSGPAPPQRVVQRIASFLLANDIYLKCRSIKRRR